jgi:hypothetical protein
MAITRISLPDSSTLDSSLKFASQDLTTIANKFISSTRTGIRKPASYSADEEYTNLFKVGPVLKDTVDGVKKLEVQVQALRNFLEGQLGRDASTSDLTPTVRFAKSDGTKITVLSFNESTGVIIGTIDTINIKTFNIGTNYKIVQNGTDLEFRYS